MSLNGRLSLLSLVRDWNNTLFTIHSDLFTTARYLSPFRSVVFGPNQDYKGSEHRSYRGVVLSWRRGEPWVRFGSRPLSAFPGRSCPWVRQGCPREPGVCSTSVQLVCGVAPGPRAWHLSGLESVEGLLCLGFWRALCSKAPGYFRGLLGPVKGLRFWPCLQAAKSARTISWALAGDPRRLGQQQRTNLLPAVAAARPSASAPVHRSWFLQGAAQAGTLVQAGAALPKGSLEPQQRRPLILGSEPADLCPGGREAGRRYSF